MSLKKQFLKAAGGKTQFSNLKEANLHELFLDSLDQIVKSEKNILEFLRFSGQLHKYTSSESIFIYAQNKEASYIADFDTWNKIGRAVKSGSKAIHVLYKDQKTQNISFKHYFDVSQTTGKEYKFPNWTVSIHEFNKIITSLKEDYNALGYSIQGDTIQEQLENIIRKSIEIEFPNGVVDNEAIVKSSKFTLLTKLGIPINEQDYYSDVTSMVDNIQSLGILKQAVQVNYSLLKEINEIRKMMVQEKGQLNEHSIQEKRRLTLSENDGVSRQQATREIREVGSSLSGGSQSNGTRIEINDRNLDDVRTPNGRKGLESVSKIDEGTTGKESSTSDTRRREKSKTYQQNEDASGRNSNPRSDSSKLIEANNEESVGTEKEPTLFLTPIWNELGRSESYEHIDDSVYITDYKGNIYPNEVELLVLEDGRIFYKSKISDTDKTELTLPDYKVVSDQWEKLSKDTKLKRDDYGGFFMRYKFKKQPILLKVEDSEMYYQKIEYQIEAEKEGSIDNTWDLAHSLEGFERKDGKWFATDECPTSSFSGKEVEIVQTKNEVFYRLVEWKEHLMLGTVLRIPKDYVEPGPWLELTDGMVIERGFNSFEVRLTDGKKHKVGNIIIEKSGDIKYKEISLDYEIEENLGIEERKDSRESLIYLDDTWKLVQGSLQYKKINDRYCLVKPDGEYGEPINVATTVDGNFSFYQEANLSNQKEFEIPDITDGEWIPLEKEIKFVYHDHQGFSIEKYNSEEEYDEWVPVFVKLENGYPFYVEKTEKMEVKKVQNNEVLSVKDTEKDKEVPEKINKDATITDKVDDEGQLGLFDLEGLEASPKEMYGKEYPLIPMSLPKKAKVTVNSDFIVAPGVKNALVNNSQEKQLKNTGGMTDFSFPNVDQFYSTGVRNKMKDNIEAIRLVKRLENEKRQADSEEQTILAKYVGWGGLTGAFDSRDSKFSDEQKELKELLTEDEYSSARESVLTSYYTSPEVIAAMYEAIEKMGFKSGRILDPSMGTGNFFSAMPKSMKAESELHGVELDLLTGQIANHLHPNAEIQLKGFEQTNFNNQSFDLVISNVPFSDETIKDKAYGKSYKIHDYFIRKSLDLVHEGGIVAVITSSGTLDKSDSSPLVDMSKKADLIGAIRLPNSTFKSIAGTDVLTDMVFFQKKKDGLEKSSAPIWCSNQLQYFADSKGEARLKGYNSYYIENPDNVLGNFEYSDFRNGTLKVKAFENTDLNELIRSKLNELKGEYSKPVKVPEALTEIKVSPTSILLSANPEEPIPNRNFSYVNRNGDLYFHENGTLTKIDLNPLDKDRTLRMVSVREHLDNVINIQKTFGYSEQEFSKGLEALNTVYDSFKEKYDVINSQLNERAFREDDSLPLLMSIENKQKDGTYTKGEVFRKATIRPKKIVTRTETAIEALQLTLSSKANVDMDNILKLYPKSLEVVLEELKDEIFINPIKYNEKSNDYWVIKDEYLTGDVKTKLMQALVHEKKNPELFSKNVEALKEVIPKDLKASEIEYKIGATWIPVEYYKQFMFETFNTRTFNRSEENGIKIDFNELNGTWFIQGKNREINSVEATTKYGTGRAISYKIFEDSLNLKKTEVRDPESYIAKSGKEAVRYKLNPQETMLAREKQEVIEESFKDWLFIDSERTANLMEIYNSRFNRIRPRVYDGSHLEFDGMNPEFELRDHQKNVVSRIMYSGRALMGHVVGGGKTASMLAAGMMMKQKGLVKKPMFVVPNHLTNQFAQELLRFYPSKNVLVTTKEDFQTINRKKFVGKIATGEYDAIIIGHSQFFKIPMSKEYQLKMTKRELDEVSYSVEKMKSEKGESWSLKQMVSFEKKLKDKLKKLSAEEHKDGLLNFEQLGVDFLFVDEAHNFKNLHTYTKLQNVAGVNTSHSQRASDMHMKCTYLLEENEGRGVVFATGTPISNSMSEMFTMQRYLQPDVLRQMGISYFDSWASTFGEIESSLEITPEGSGYQMKNRFSKFHNLPELMTAFNLVADIQTAEMLKLPVPKIRTGKAELVVIQASDFQEKMMVELGERAEAIRLRQVEPHVDNMLKLTHEAKLMAIDPRLIDKNAPDERFSKLGVCCDKVFTIWMDSKDKKSTQMIFSDSGTPKKDKFNVYHEVKKQLMEKGIPEKEIAFIHDAKNDKQKDILFDKMRKGDVRILLGSTSKVGTGTNVQNKLLAVHHVDVPWRPSDIEQRDGRIVRQGNENEEVQVFRYVTKGTFDSYLWQIQEQKLRFISQVMTGKSISRSCDDLDETVLDAAEVKAIASGNPKMAEKMTLDNEVARLQLIKSRFIDEQIALRDKAENKIPKNIKRLEVVALNSEKDGKKVKEFEGNEFFITIEGLSYTTRKEAAAHLDSICLSLSRLTTEEKEIGEYKGLNLKVAPTVFATGYTLSVVGERDYRVDITTGTEIGSIRKIENLVDKIPGESKIIKEEIEELKEQQSSILQQLKEPFKQEEQLISSLKRQLELNVEIESEAKGNVISENQIEKEDEFIAEK